MKLESRKAKLLAIVFALLIIALVTISSYAYFSASVLGNDQSKNMVITTGNMEVTFTDGQQIAANNLIPGDYVEKEFTVTNTGDVPTSYGIYFNNVENTFSNPDDLVYELISENGTNVSQTKCPIIDDTIKNAVAIDVGQTHHYTLKLTFKETGENQDINKGKIFSSIINIEKKYDSIRAETKLVRTGYSFNTGTVYDENYASLSEFNKDYSFYLKQDLTRYYATVHDYALLVQKDAYEDYSSIEACEEKIREYNDPNTTYECEEQNGKIFTVRTGNPTASLEECKNYFYHRNDETGELEPRVNDDYSNECIEKTGETTEILIKTTSANDKVCHSNGDSEVCFDKWMKYDAYYDFVDNNDYKRYVYDKFQELYNKINQEKKYICYFRNEGEMQCFSEDNQLVEFTGYAVTVSGMHHTSKYYLYNQKHSYDNIYDCYEASNQTEHSSNCIIDNNEIYFYSYTYNYDNGRIRSADTLEACKNDRYYINDEVSICAQIYWSEFSISFPVCTINDTKAECRDQIIW